MVYNTPLLCSVNQWRIQFVLTSNRFFARLIVVLLVEVVAPADIASAFNLRRVVDVHVVPPVPQINRPLSRSTKLPDEREC